MNVELIQKTIEEATLSGFRSSDEKADALMLVDQEYKSLVEMIVTNQQPKVGMVGTSPATIEPAKMMVRSLLGLPENIAELNVDELEQFEELGAKDAINLIVQAIVSVNVASVDESPKKTASVGERTNRTATVDQPSKMARFTWITATLCIGIGAVGYFSYGRSIEASTEPSIFECSSAYPIQVTIRNFTFTTVHRTLFKMEAWKNNVSQNLLENGLRPFEFPRVIEPFSSETGCFSDSYFTPPDVKWTSHLEEVIKNADWVIKRRIGIQLHIYDVQFQTLE